MNLRVILYYCEIIWLSFNYFLFQQKSLLQHSKKKPFDLYYLSIINLTENTPMRGMLLIAAEGSDWQPHFTKWDCRVFRTASWQQLSSVKGTGQAIQLGSSRVVLQGMSVVQENSLSLSTLVYVGQHGCIWTHFLSSCEHPSSEDLSVALARIVIGLVKKQGPKFLHYILFRDIKCNLV